MPPQWIRWRHDSLSQSKSHCHRGSAAAAVAAKVKKTEKKEKVNVSFKHAKRSWQRHRTEQEDEQMNLEIESLRRFVDGLESPESIPLHIEVPAAGGQARVLKAQVSVASTEATEPATDLEWRTHIASLAFEHGDVDAALALEQSQPIFR